MKPEETNYLEQMETELQALKVENAQVKKEYGQISMFGGGDNENLIKYQLDLNEDLERVDHLLRGHTLKHNKDGELVWMNLDDNSFRPFNEFGVDMLMKIISFYLNRNTILSNYSEEMINWKIKDLGDEIADLIFMEYDAMGMDTPEKKKQYPMIVRELIDTVHSAYLRALGGGERDSLRTARHVSQTDNPMMQMMNQGKIPTAKRSIFKPTSWMKV